MLKDILLLDSTYIHDIIIANLIFYRNIINVIHHNIQYTHFQLAF